MAISTPDGSRTLAAVLGAWGRTLAAPDAALPSPLSSQEPEPAEDPATVASAAATAAATAAALTRHVLTAGRPEAPQVRRLPTSMGEARRVFAEQEARIGSLERQLREALLRAGRRTTEARNLEARLNALLPLAEQIEHRDRALAQAQAALAAAEQALAELRASRDMSRAVTEAI